MKQEERERDKGRRNEKDMRMLVSGEKAKMEREGKQVCDEASVELRPSARLNRRSQGVTK